MKKLLRNFENLMKDLLCVISFLFATTTNAATLEFSTFLGGSSTDRGYDIDVTDNGEVVVTGMTTSSSYPTTTGSYDQSHNGGEDVFVTKLPSDGSSLWYSTFLGGSNTDRGQTISVDSNENAYITGYTGSTNFPTYNALDSSHNGGTWDIFITKLTSDGSGLGYSTYFGGSLSDYGNQITVDSSGNAILTGVTQSTDFPTQNALDSSFNGGTYDAFITKLTSNGSSLSYSTFLGGLSNDGGYAITIDGSGNVILTGVTQSSNFPTQNAYDSSYNGGEDVFVTKLTSDGSSLIYSTFLGGSSHEAGFQISINGSGNAILTGYTNSSNFPTQNAYDSSYNGGEDVFITKLTSDGSNLSYSTFLGGSGDDYGYGISVDSSGNAYVTGRTSSTNFPTQNPITSNNNGNADLFVTQINSLGASLEFSTFLGGASDDIQNVVGNPTVYKNGSLFLTGLVGSGFPTSNGAYDETYNGGDFDAIVAKLDFNNSTPISASANLEFSTFLGGTSNEFPYSISVDGSGNSYVIGYTESSDFPTITGSYDIIQNGNDDVFVTKLNSAGTSLDYSTFLGGISNDYGFSISVDGNGNSYFMGYTYSNSFPTNSYDTSYNGSGDVFVTKLNSNGNSLGYSTFLGGGFYDYGYSLSVDGNEDIFVTGETTSSNFPTVSGSYGTSNNGSNDVFVTKLDGNFNSLLFSTYLGGSAIDYGSFLEVDGSGNSYITGYTHSNNFPTNSYDTSFNGNRDVFVTKLNSSGSSLDYSTFLGGSDYEEGNSLAIDLSGNCYVTGRAGSSNFPTTIGAIDTSFDNGDVFVTKLNGNGNSLSFSTFIGGSDYETGNFLEINGSGNCYVTGYTSSNDFPVNVYDTLQNGNTDIFITELNGGGNSLINSTYFGGSDEDRGNSLSIDGSGNVYLAGYTSSNNFPATNGVFSEFHSGGTDAIISKFNLNGTGIDGISPTQISDFTLASNNGTSAKLRWTATGDDSTSGTANSYEIRRSTNEITEANFSSATLVSNIPTPSASGILDSVTVSGLTSGTQYYFGIKAFDNAGNESPLSTQTSLGRAEITSISDVGNDNGGNMRINFNASLNDYTSTGINVSGYAIFRKQNPNFSPISKGSNQIFESLPSGNWEQVGTLLAFGDQTYTTVVPTLADSNSTGTHEFEFLVRTQAFGNGAINSVSEVVSGYSIDNLPPAIPPNQNFVNNGNGTTTANWNSVTDSDLAFYTIWAEVSQDNFSLVTQVSPNGTGLQSETFNDVSGAISYAVGSVDFNGNESLPFVSRISSLRIEVVGNDVVLNWVGKQDATVYRIYRATTPDFANSVQIGTYTPNGVEPSFVDLGIASSGQEYFYYVTWEN